MNLKQGFVVGLLALATDFISAHAQNCSNTTISNEKLDLALVLSEEYDCVWKNQTSPTNQPNTMNNTLFLSSDYVNNQYLPDPINNNLTSYQITSKSEAYRYLGNRLTEILFNTTIFSEFRDPSDLYPTSGLDSRFYLSSTNNNTLLGENFAFKLSPDRINFDIPFKTSFLSAFIDEGNIRFNYNHAELSLAKKLSENESINLTATSSYNCPKPQITLSYGFSF